LDEATFKKHSERLWEIKRRREGIFDAAKPNK